ncbi:glycoside hydrolase family 16 protein [Kribbella sp. NPDC056861]|uniref:glycoside hydrolase family 16 protein n=1 Tax=Kribbella sp. NPDC056861 TaxID=3154857 RepID=UPI0034420E98
MRSRPKKQSTRRRTLLSALLAPVLVAVPLTIAAQASVPTPPAGWTNIWSDDFDGANNTLPSSANWIIDTGHSYPGGAWNWGTGEIQNYTNSTNNLKLDGTGNLVITPRRDSSGNWTSGRIETQRSDFKPPAGGVVAMEARVQMPNITGEAAVGYWPAFWALGAPYRGNYQNWPSIGELDIMENVNGLNTVWATLHCGVNPGGPCNETNGLGASRACPGSSCQSAFHTYRIEWDASVSPNQLRWYVDGQQFHSLSQGQLPADTWNNMTNHNGYFLLLNVAIGGGFPDGVRGSTTPIAATVPDKPMLVDYVAVSTKAGSGTPTSPPTTPPTGGSSAYSTIQAESYSGQSGIGVETTLDSGGGQNIMQIANGDWAKYSAVNFGSTAATQFVGRVASGIGGGASGLVEVRLDSRTNVPVGSFALGNTGSWQTYRTIPTNISAVTGVHDVYLTFTSGQPADFVNVNWFTFGH